MKELRLNTLLKYANRRALGTAIAVMLALLLTNYLQLRSGGWAVVAAFLVCQTTRGTPLRQGMIIFFYMLMALFISVFLHAYHNSIVIQIILGTFMILGAYWVRPNFTALALFAGLILIATLQPYHFTLLNDQRIFACIIGALTGMIITMIIAPANLEREFAAGLQPLLSALEIYAKSLCIYPGRNAVNANLADKINIERAMLANVKHYPEWVYEIGFNPGLRSGFRYVLVNIDHAIECLFSLSAVFTQNLNPELIEKIKDVLNASLKRNSELFAILSAYFQDKALPPYKTDFTQDIVELENALKRLVPESLEFIDLSPDYLSLTTIVRDIKDLRQLLLQLIAALPTT